MNDHIKERILGLYQTAQANVEPEPACVRLRQRWLDLTGELIPEGMEEMRIGPILFTPTDKYLLMQYTVPGWWPSSRAYIITNREEFADAMSRAVRDLKL